GMVTASMLLGGGWSDQWGTRKSMTVALLLGWLGRSLLAASLLFGNGGPGVAVVATQIMAFATGILQPTLYAGVKKTAPPIVAAMGFSMLYAIMNLGSAAESFVSPFLRTDAEFLPHIKGLNLGIAGVIGTLSCFTLAQLVVHLAFYPHEHSEDATEPSGLGA